MRLVRGRLEHDGTRGVNALSRNYFGRRDAVVAVCADLRLGHNIDDYATVRAGGVAPMDLSSFDLVRDDVAVV
jgi:hypothetical protein